MRILARTLCIFVVTLITCYPAQAQPGILWVRVSNLKDQPMSNIQIGTKGYGSTVLTTRTGLAKIILAQGGQSGTWVTLQVLSKSYEFVSPYDKRVLVPPFDGGSDNYVQVYLVTLKDREALESGRFAVAMAAKFNATLKPAQKGEAPTESDRKDALTEVARSFGFTPEEVNQTILNWGKKASDPYDKGIIALYEKNYPEATAQLSRSYELRETQLADAAFFLGQSLYEQGKYRDAVEKFRTANNLKAYNATYLRWLGLSLDYAGKYAEAEQLIKRALEIYENSLGPGHREVAATLHNLANIYREQEKYAEAELLYKRSLAIKMKVLGPEHSKVGETLNDLALIYRAQGKYAEAEPLFKRALATHEKASGPEHPDVATVLNNLAGLYEFQRKYDEAKPLYQRARAIYEKALGTEHPFVAMILNNIALLYRKQGKYAEAEPLFKRDIEISEKALGQEHPEIAITLDNLATLYRLQGKYAEAEPLYQRALAIFEKAQLTEHTNFARALQNYAELLHEMNRNDDATKFYERAQEIRNKKAKQN